MEERVQQGLLEAAWGTYMNGHSVVPKKNGKYGFIIFAMGTNRYTLEDTGLPPNV